MKYLTESTIEEVKALDKNNPADMAHYRELRRQIADRICSQKRAGGDYAILRREIFQEFQALHS